MASRSPRQIEKAIAENERAFHYWTGQIPLLYKATDMRSLKRLKTANAHVKRCNARRHNLAAELQRELENKRRGPFAGR